VRDATPGANDDATTPTELMMMEKKKPTKKRVCVGLGQINFCNNIDHISLSDSNSINNLLSMEDKLIFIPAIRTSSSSRSDSQLRSTYADASRAPNEAARAACETDERKSGKG
jgi:hypothetical protein